MTPKPATLLRKLSYTWIRGPAVRDGDQIVLDSQRAEAYEPVLLDRNVGIALARVRTPDDAVAFAADFGLLTEPRSWLKFEPIPVSLSQSWADFEREATAMRRHLDTTLDVRKAVNGDRKALARLHERFSAPAPDDDVVWRTRDGAVTVKARDCRTAEELRNDDVAILTRANTWAADGLLQELGDRVRPYVFEPAQLFPDQGQQPGQIRIGLIGNTLLDYCYLSLALGLANEPIMICEECQRPFVITDKRQRFCETSCANRARFLRFKNKRKPAATSVQPKRRRVHGKRKKAR